MINIIVKILEDILSLTAVVIVIGCGIVGFASSNPGNFGTLASLPFIDQGVIAEFLAAASAIQSVVPGEHAANDIFVYVEAKSVSDLPGDFQIAKLGIAALQFDDSRDEFGGRTFGTGFAWTTGGREQKVILALDQGLMKFQ